MNQRREEMVTRIEKLLIFLNLFFDYNYLHIVIVLVYIIIIKSDIAIILLTDNHRSDMPIYIPVVQFQFASISL